MKNFSRNLKSIHQNLHLLFTLNGILLAAVFFFGTESKYESELFTAITRKIKDSLPKNHSKEAFALKANQVAYQLEENRYTFFSEQNIAGIKANFFHPATYDLMTGNGACASYAAVLARILKANDIRVRIGQMQVNGLYGGHMFIEAELEDGWKVLDPMFALAFKKSNGQLAGFTDLQQNWEFYKPQTPANYKAEYSYRGVRYANWKKIPVVTPMIKASLDFFIGKEKADKISIRPYLLRNYNKLAWLSAFLLVLNLIKTIMVYRKKTKSAIEVSIEDKMNVQQLAS